MEIRELEGHHKACKYCGTFFSSVRSDAKYCSSKCQSKHYKKRLRRKAMLQGFLAAFGLNNKSREEKEGETLKKKIDYARLTFVLSVIGFLGSVGFYFGVLRQMYSPTSDRQKIEVLKDENSALKNTIHVLIEKIEEDGEDGE